MKLIIVNYSMSSRSLVFSHQREVVLALSQFFDSVEVFTTETSSESLPENVKVTLISWKAQSPLRNIVTILKLLYPALIKNRASILFTHMTDVHAAIVAPWAWLLRMRHILWYAHAKNSRYLVWASFFVTRIVSSTPGSCNLKLNKRKIHFINQGINSKDFPYSPGLQKNLRKILYYGRLDPSKNIHLFYNLVSELNCLEDSYTINVFGRPTNLGTGKHFSDYISSPNVNEHKSAITFGGPIIRTQIAATAEKYDIFLNLFSGSLDKTLIEATFMGMPVVTWNREYCSQFGTWSNSSVSETLEFIIKEFKSINSFKEDELRAEKIRRLELVVKSHSFEGWINRLISVLNKE